MFQKLKNKIFKKKLAKLGFDMTEGSENERIATALNERGLGGDHFVKCMQDTIATKRLQDICEAISGRKEAGRILQLSPLVIQCHTCQKDFSDKKGVIFVEETINLESMANIIYHLNTCTGVLCDCGKVKPFFDKCKKCGMEWDKSSAHMIGWRKDYPFTKKQQKQIDKYKCLVDKQKGTDGGNHA